MSDSNIAINKLLAVKDALTRCMEKTDEEITKTEFEFMQLLNLTKAARESKEKFPEKIEEDIPEKINAQTLQFLDFDLKPEKRSESEESDND